MKIKYIFRILVYEVNLAIFLIDNGSLKEEQSYRLRTISLGIKSFLVVCLLKEYLFGPVRNILKITKINLDIWKIVTHVLNRCRWWTSSVLVSEWASFRFESITFRSSGAVVRTDHEDTALKPLLLMGVNCACPLPPPSFIRCAHPHLSYQDTVVVVLSLLSYKLQKLTSIPWWSHYNRFDSSR